MSKLHYVIHSPFIPVLLIVALFSASWYHYTSAEPLLSQSTDNIMPNAGLEELDSRGIPRDWTLAPANEKVRISSQPGYQSLREFSITSPATTTASTYLTTPSVAIKKDKLYLYKGFYRSTIPFDIIMQSTKKNGSVQREITRHYTASKEWTTFSHLFKSDPTTQSVAFQFQLSAAGEFHIDNTYLEPDPSGVTPPRSLATGANLLPSIEQPSNNWQARSYGDLQIAPSDPMDSMHPYLHLQVASYKDGEAAWQHPAITTTGNQTYQLRLTYKSSAPTDLRAEYTPASGEHAFSTLTRLQPAGEWTTTTVNFETPRTATYLNVAAVLRSIGAIDTKDYSLINTTRSGIGAWNRPLLSITFDDGWESAFQNAVPLLAASGYKATFYLTPSALNTANFMSSDDVTTLTAAGHEIASHGDEHVDMTTLTRPALTAQLSHAADYFHTVQKLQTIQFSTPFGTTDPQVDYVARQYYASLRTTDDGINTKQNFDPYHLLVLYIGSDTPPAKVASAIADARAVNGWLILVYHRVDTNTEGEPVISPRQLQAQLDTIRQSHISVVPVGTALHELASQQGS